jgi:hypothetical protein
LAAGTTGAPGEDAFEAAVGSGRLCPSPFEPRWPYSSWLGNGAGDEAPQCAYCGEPVRLPGSERATPLPGHANPPWNAGWDGTCETCGSRFELVINTPLHFDARRTTTFRPASKPYRTFIDEGFVLSGVEVTVTDEQFAPAGAQARTETLFLSMAEVARLAEALQGRLRIYLEQLDWSHDWT